MKKVLILGGSSDIGIEVVKKFLNLNWSVQAHYFKNKKKLVDLKKKNKHLKIIKLNFSDYNKKNFENKLKNKFNSNFDSFINLIGYTDGKSYDSTKLKDITKVLTINTFIPIIVQKILLKKMIKNKWGRILNCSGIGVKFGGGKYNYNYSLSQHCREFIPSTFKDLAKNNILINNIRIGVTDTKIHKKIKKNIKNRIKLIPINRMATTKEMASYITNLSSESNSYMTGQTISVSGGE